MAAGLNNVVSELEVAGPCFLEAITYQRKRHRETVSLAKGIKRTDPSLRRYGYWTTAAKEAARTSPPYSYTFELNGEDPDAPN